jgi:hypothetical protein
MLNSAIFINLKPDDLTCFFFNYCTIWQVYPGGIILAIDTFYLALAQNQNMP